jgi:hypothetical protein
MKMLPRAAFIRSLHFVSLPAFILPLYDVIIHFVVGVCQRENERYTYQPRDVKDFGDGTSSFSFFVIIARYSINPKNVGGASLSLPSPNIKTTKAGSIDAIDISVSGSTDSIKELVRNSGNYFVRMRITNLWFEGVIRAKADVQSIEVLKK